MAEDLYHIDKSGRDEESLYEAVEDIDSITDLKSFYGKAVTIQVQLGDRETKYACFNRDNNGVVTRNAVHWPVPDNESDKRFREEVDKTGIVFVVREEEGVDLYCMNRTALKALCGKLNLYGNASEGNDYYRNMYMANQLFKKETLLIDALVFVARRTDQGRCNHNLITGVVTNRYGTCSLSTAYEMIREMAPGRHIRRWHMTDELITIEAEYPKEKRTYISNWPGYETIIVIPGLRVIGSSCGKSSWKIQAILYSEEGEYMLEETRIKNTIQAKPVEEGKRRIKKYRDLIAEHIAKMDRASLMPKRRTRQEVIKEVHEMNKALYKRIGKKRGAILDRYVETGCSGEKGLTCLDTMLFPFITEHILAGYTA